MATFIHELLHAALWFCAGMLVYGGGLALFTAILTYLSNKH